MKISAYIYDNDRGVALLLVLWIIVLLALICAEFSVTMRTETTVARNFKEGEQAYYAAEAGVNRAILEIMRTARSSAARTSAFSDTADTEAMDAEEQADFEYWTAGNSYEIKIGDMTCRVELEDESNKVDINEFLKDAKKNTELLKQVLRKKIGLEGEEVDIVADSLIDWQDADNNVTGVNGAEDDFYKDLDPPYLCRNGAIPVVEELLLVRGIDEQILFGRRGRLEKKIELSEEDLDDILSGRMVPPEEMPVPDADDDEASQQYLGLIDIFSAPPSGFGTGAKVNAQGEIMLNINTATFDQLLLLNGMTPQTAAEIVYERRKRIFAAREDRLPSFKNYYRWKDGITVSSGGRSRREMLRINATGCDPEGLVCRRITCTVLFSGTRYFIFSWRETS